MLNVPRKTLRNEYGARMALPEPAELVVFASENTSDTVITVSVRPPCPPLPVIPLICFPPGLLLPGTGMWDDFFGNVRKASTY